MGIVVKHSIILNPTGNSISERVNKTINEIMRMYAFKLKTHEIEEIIENRLNLICHSTLNVSPFELFLGYKPFTYEPISSIRDLIKESNHKTRNKAISRIQQNSNLEFYKHLINEYVYVRAIYNGKLASLWKDFSR
ncbi:hypothetical protein DMUE_0115 [Dictyocoela muelleri]|nr:hypothetical protein DMUE_0115 [Dictyocoela muelleri]